MTRKLRKKHVFRTLIGLFLAVVNILLHQPQYNTANELQESVATDCKTLWFAGFHAAEKSFREYSENYVAALESSILNAPNLLQPVVMLGTFLVDDPKLSERIVDFAVWAKSKGARVINLPYLSFQDKLEKYLANRPVSFRHGPYLRLEIPRLVEEYSLFAPETYKILRGYQQTHEIAICQDAVLYTDSDIIFWNITAGDLAEGRQMVSNSTPYVAYGSEAFMKYQEPSNTGVMMFSPSRFAEAMPSIFDFGVQRGFGNDRVVGEGGWHDQALLNAYFESGHLEDRIYLPDEWNYKSYWGSALDPKIVHLHGPKPKKYLECLASMDSNSSACHVVPSGHPYAILIGTGFDSDGGAFANKVFRMYQTLINGTAF